MTGKYWHCCWQVLAMLLASTGTVAGKTGKYWQCCWQVLALLLARLASIGMLLTWSAVESRLDWKTGRNTTLGIFCQFIQKQSLCFWAVESYILISCYWRIAIYVTASSVSLHADLNALSVFTKRAVVRCKRLAHPVHTWHELLSCVTECSR